MLSTFFCFGLIPFSAVTPPTSNSLATVAQILLLKRRVCVSHFWFIIIESLMLRLPLLSLLGMFAQVFELLPCSIRPLGLVSLMTLCFKVTLPFVNWSSLRYSLTWCLLPDYSWPFHWLLKPKCDLRWRFKFWLHRSILSLSFISLFTRLKSVYMMLTFQSLKLKTHG